MILWFRIFKGEYRDNVHELIKTIVKALTNDLNKTNFFISHKRGG